LLSAAVASAVGLLGFAGPASASSGPAYGDWYHAKPTGARAAPGATLAPGAPAPYFAGYYYSTGLPSVTVTTTFVVPKAKCGHVTTFVGIGVATFSPHSFNAALLEVACTHGRAQYIPILGHNNKAKPEFSSGVAPGDKIVVKERGSSTGVSLSFADKTNRKANTKMTAPGDTGFAPEIGDLKKSHKVGGNFVPWPVTDFGHVSFTNSKLNGQPFGSFPVIRYDMVNGAMTVQIATGPFASNNEAFKTTFKHS
jgi:hypothetical protein